MEHSTSCLLHKYHVSEAGKVILPPQKTLGLIMSNGKKIKNHSLFMDNVNGKGCEICEGSNSLEITPLFGWQQSLNSIT